MQMKSKNFEAQKVSTPLEFHKDIPHRHKVKRIIAHYDCLIQIKAVVDEYKPGYKLGDTIGFCERWFSPKKGVGTSN